MTTSQWTVNRDDALECLEVLRSSERVCLPTHQHVDADGFGTPLAIMHALRYYDVESFVLVSDGRIPGNLRFLPGSRKALAYGTDSIPNYDQLCLVDCADRKRLGGFYRDDPDRVNGSVPIINIDHHITNDHFGSVNIVEASAASTAEIVAEIFEIWEVPMTFNIAQCLLAGIYGDTLGLRTEATTAGTMRTSASLVDAGANPSTITDSLFRIKPPSTVCLWRHALDHVTWTGKLIWTEITEEIMDECGADASEAEGLVNFLAGTSGSLAAAILYQVEDGWRVSLRSLQQDVDVAAIAAEFGGGGHPRAAGCQVPAGLDNRDAFLKKVTQLAESAGH